VKLVLKKDLRVHDGWLVDADNNVIPAAILADEVNSIHTLAAHVEFAKAHKEEIEKLAKGEKIEFVRPEVSSPKPLTTGITVATPLKDAAKAEAEALANEWLAKQSVDDADEMLKKFKTLATWLELDYILLDPTDEVWTSSKFLVDPLTITRGFVVDTVVAYCDPDVRKLVNSVAIR
jgi:hypothetical protein